LEKEKKEAEKSGVVDYVIDYTELKKILEEKKINLNKISGKINP
jgi:translation initiation factor IF-1